MNQRSTSLAHRVAGLLPLPLPRGTKGIRKYLLTGSPRQCFSTGCGVDPTEAHPVVVPGLATRRAVARRKYPDTCSNPTR